MARGGGGGRGGGRGGRSFSHTRHHGTSRSTPATPGERFLEFLIFIFIVLMALMVRAGDSDALYDESQLSDFASEQYQQAFGETQSYEDNLLLTFVVYEDRSQYAYMTWVGDHIGDEAFEYLQGDGTWLDELLDRQLETDYQYSLSADLTRALRELARQMPEEPYTCHEDHSDSPTALQNLSDLSLNRTLIEDALLYFRETTGIPIVLVVEDAADIFR